MSVVGEFSFSSRDGGEFLFSHSYDGGTQCGIELVYLRDGSPIIETEFVMSINRTKLKWKQTDLGVYKVRYRCIQNTWHSENPTKRQKKQ